MTAPFYHILPNRYSPDRHEACKGWYREQRCKQKGAAADLLLM